MNDSNLIFIISQPRSGSTLLQKIVSNNNFINTVSEHWLLLPFLSALRTDIQNAVYDSALASEVIHEFLKNFKLENIYLQEQKKFLLALYEPLLKDGAEYVLDKTPRYYEILNELVTLFPGAKIIVLIRDPLDVLQSVIQTWNVKSLRGLDYYARDILAAPVLLDKFFTEQMHNPNVMRFYYEDILENSETEITRLFNWLTLPFEASVLEFTNNEKTSGKRGDPTGIKMYKKIVKKNEKASNTKVHQQIWKTFIAGYKLYLKNLAMSSYNRYNFDNAKSTSAFNYYVKTNTAKTKQRRLNMKDVFIFIKTKTLNNQKS